jgi:chromosome segregation ATPase
MSDVPTDAASVEALADRLLAPEVRDLIKVLSVAAVTLRALRQERDEAIAVKNNALSAWAHDEDRADDAEAERDRLAAQLAGLVEARDNAIAEAHATRAEREAWKDRTEAALAREAKLRKALRTIAGMDIMCASAVAFNAIHETEPKP